MDNYLDQGYNLFVDNFYTSPTLASDLFARKTHLTGTLDRSRKNTPPEVDDCFDKLSQKSTTGGEGLYVRDGCIVYIQNVFQFCQQDILVTLKTL